MKNTVLATIVLLLVSSTLGFVLSEMSLRFILFTDIPAFAWLRKPGHFAGYFSEDNYWKLYYRFNGEFKPPKRPHPLLGWIGDFSRVHYFHNQTDRVGTRRPVLLYGDSFAGCAPNVECFQEILNMDTDFSEDHFLLNYGVGGYGVGQIFLLFQNSVQLYDNPFVIVSLMTLDLDRSILKVRTGQKPYFRIEDATLQLKGIPIDPSPAHFYAMNPTEVTSYLYRLVLYSGIVPGKVASFLRGDEQRIEEKKEINKRIILQIAEKLRATNLDFIFLIFHPDWPGVSRLGSESDWRSLFLRQVLHDNGIPYIWSADVYRKDSKRLNSSRGKYISPDNWHPTSHFNRLIGQEIKQHVFGKRNDFLIERP